MNIKNLSLIALFTFSLVISFAQTGTNLSRKDIADSCDRFMKEFQIGNYKGSIQILKKNSIIDAASIDKLSLKMGDQVDIISSNYGEMTSYQLVKEKAVGDFLVRRYYVMKLQKFYLKFTFTLYNPGTGWKMTAFVYNEDIEELFN